MSVTGINVDCLQALQAICPRVIRCAVVHLISQDRRRQLTCAHAVKELADWGADDAPGRSVAEPPRMLTSCLVLHKDWPAFLEPKVLVLLWCEMQRDLNYDRCHICLSYSAYLYLYIYLCPNVAPKTDIVLPSLKTGSKRMVKP